MAVKLQKLIEILISKNKEGEYWDYKREWHKSNGKLLHDILCFANTIHDRNYFIIFGYDEEEGLIGVSKNNRKKQADVLDMLSNIRFSGGNVPRIKVNTVTIEKKIDILEICNSYELPFFIITKFQEVNSGLIYSQIGDMNTAINESTNIYIMQGIWKKRFRLNQPAINQFQNLLTRKEEWFQNSEGWYNIFQPDFYMVEEYDDDRYKYPEFYSYVITNENTSYRNVKLMVHGTEIDSHQIVLLDSGVYKTSVPTWQFLRFNDLPSKRYQYKYYIEGTIEHSLYNFFSEEDSAEYQYAKDNYKEVIIIFKDKSEKEDLEKFVLDHKLEFLENIKVTEKSMEESSFIEPNNLKARKNILEKINIGRYLNELIITLRKK